jgi:hypothetical protein
MTARAAVGPRYAAFLCPDPKSAAGAAAAEWVGRCAARDVPVSQPFVPGLSESLFAALTDEPRRHGFHGTLTAPFHAAAGVSRRAIIEEVEAIAASHPPFMLPPLAVRLHRECLVLAPEGEGNKAATLAAECVLRLDPLRALPSTEEIRDRVMHGLSARQHGLLLRWGDPFVMDEFRLHFPLTGQVTVFGEEVAERLCAQAAEHFRDVMEDLRRVEHIALFEQRSPAAAFRMTVVAPLRSSLPRNGR